MRTVIFLDLDGPVIKNHVFIGDSVYRLNKLCEERNAEIVITTSVTSGTGSLDSIKAYIKAKCPEFPVTLITDKTDIIEYCGLEVERGAEIDIYLQKNKDINKYVIIDDECVALLSQEPCFVQVGESGFSESDFLNAFRILG